MKIEIIGIGIPKETTEAIAKAIETRTGMRPEK